MYTYAYSTDATQGSSTTGSNFHTVIFQIQLLVIALYMTTQGSIVALGVHWVDLLWPLVHNVWIHSGPMFTLCGSIVALGLQCLDP